MEWELDLDSKIDQLLDMYPSSFLTEILFVSGVVNGGPCSAGY
jgi:hypothetical protein